MTHAAPASTATMRDRADRLQADYFLALLTHNRRLIDDRIAAYRNATAAAQAAGDAEAARTFRRMTLSEERDRSHVDGMIAGLLRRFPRRGAGQAAPHARLVRVGAR
jgi:hypothetical protein